MKGDHLSAKVTLAGCAGSQPGIFLMLEGSKEVPCIDTHSDSFNSPYNLC